MSPGCAGLRFAVTGRMGGMFLTQKAEVLPEHESRLYVTQITVTDETKDNYREATLEEKEAYENSLLNANRL